MNSREYLGRFTNGAIGNIALVAILLLASVVALISIPLSLAA